ncbi:hypothetical protein AB0K14_14080 [Actinosynnema sp. NPDC050801]|uniref:hypothetical protein n=1 Tax=unclassified Actinosynnema TaxID=2637065 RepID=UPI0033FAB7F1
MIALAAIAVLVIVAGVVTAVIAAIPDHRTSFLLDASAGGDTTAVVDAVDSAARNSGDGDALALRTFGGTCGDPGNTRELVPSAAGNGTRIGEAARGVNTAGEATLFDGVLAAVDDFSGIYPFRGRHRNRIIVVTTHGADACTEAQDATLKAIRDRVEAIGVRMDLRVIGYQVPDEQREALARLTEITGSAEPEFAATAAELDTVLQRLSVPDRPDADRLDVPGLTQSTTPPPPPFRPFAYETATDIRLLNTPEAEPVVLAQNSENEPGLGELVWSADGKRLAWLDFGGDAARQVELYHVGTGVRHSWTCVGCGIAFVGNLLVSSDGAGTGWLSYPDDGGPPTSLTIPGLPGRPADTPEGLHVQYMTTIRTANSYKVHAVNSGGVSTPERTVYRVLSDVTAEPAFTVRGVPGFRTMATNEDENRIAYVSDELVILDKDGRTISRDDLGLESSTGGSGRNQTVSDVRFLPGDDVSAITLTSPAPIDADPDNSLPPWAGVNKVRSATPTTHRYSSGNWTRTATAEPIVEDAGGGWVTTLVYTGMASSRGVGTLTLTGGGRSVTVAQDVRRVLPRP